MGNDLFETFDNGSLRLPKSTAEFAGIPWTKHPAFDGVNIPYEPGVISVMPAGVPHEVNAGSDGLFLFAKFMPALC